MSVPPITSIYYPQNTPPPTNQETIDAVSKVYRSIASLHENNLSFPSWRNACLVTMPNPSQQEVTARIRSFNDWIKTSYTPFASQEPPINLGPRIGKISHLPNELVLPRFSTLQCSMKNDLSYSVNALSKLQTSHFTLDGVCLTHFPKEILFNPQIKGMSFLLPNKGEANITDQGLLDIFKANVLRVEKHLPPLERLDIEKIDEIPTPPTKKELHELKSAWQHQSPKTEEFQQKERAFHLKLLFFHTQIGSITVENFARDDNVPYPFALSAWVYSVGKFVKQPTYERLEIPSPLLNYIVKNEPPDCRNPYDVDSEWLSLKEEETPDYSFMEEN